MKNGPYELVVAPPEYPGKLYRNKYCYEHHLVWWLGTGNLPASDEVIHHRNEQKRDNRFENLELKTKARHTTEHNVSRRDVNKYPHGSLARYQRYKCRCRMCKDANAISSRKYK